MKKFKKVGFLVALGTGIAVAATSAEKASKTGKLRREIKAKEKAYALNDVYILEDKLSYNKATNEVNKNYYAASIAFREQVKTKLLEHIEELNDELDRLYSEEA